MDKKLVIVYAILISLFTIAYPFMKSSESYLTEVNQDNELDQKIKCGPIPDRNLQDMKKKQNKANIIFTMDDGWDTQYTKAFPILKEKGMKGSIAVIPTKVGTSGYMSLSQLNTLYSSGWDLMNHTYSHHHLAHLSKQKQKKELSQGRTWLNNHCYKRASDIAVYPYGSYNQDTLNILQEEHYRSARTVIDGIQSNNLKKYEVPTINLLPSTNVEWVKEQIDMAIQTKQTIVFTNHRFDKEADAAQMNFDPAKFKEIVNYVDSKKDQLNILTYSEWLDIKGIH
ncbi:polysaccharide deacetylase family protein [Bacillus sp. RG28]|uniref:Polysaccharide deacetylase family protein n=1 Tax=Gottfriedia endophytica TaxID=2820819 RepID=A0A940NLW4_9BACI|nr:polysaccharide deacetylase family protein [Gottfriedia endophytica]MBP0726657.1 polysaccharide deacetylase family protein [Gottfriedia endophytica]